ncbi:hypothetical protein ES703_11586 [subsurface metagenome]
MNALLARFRHSAALIIIGFFLIIYIALGFLYYQQGAQQKEFEEQIAKLSSVVAKKLPDITELQEEYDEVNVFLAPITGSDALTDLVGIAKKSGINVDPESGKLSIPPPTVSEKKVGDGSYQVLSFKNVRAQGDYNRVMAFISALDSGEELDTMVLVLTRINTSQVEVIAEGEEETKTETVATLDVDIYTKPGNESP